MRFLRVTTIYVLIRSMKNIKNFHFLVVKFSVYLNRRVFIMTWWGGERDCLFSLNRVKGNTNSSKIYRNKRLTHKYTVNSSSPLFGQINFQFKACLVCFFNYYHFYRNSCLIQAVKTLNRRCVLICFYTLLPKFHFIAPGSDLVKWILLFLDLFVIAFTLTLQKLLFQHDRRPEHTREITNETVRK